MALRIRRADIAPGVVGDEYFGRTPESVLTDRDCSPGAKALYAAITLAMTIDRTPKICLATMSDLADLIGLEIRQTRRYVAELERRGHVVRERVRSMAGSPQGIRPTARLKGARTRSDPTDCNRSSSTDRPVILDRAPGQIRPGDRSSPTAPLKREAGEGEKQQQDPAGCAGAGVALSPEEGTGDAPGRADFLRGLVTDLAGALALEPEPGARKSPGEPSAKTPPRAASRPSVRPDVVESTTSPKSTSRRETKKGESEHNPH
jgi:hypothetical protein